jgi:hypothetical protein
MTQTLHREQRAAHSQESAVNGLLSVSGDQNGTPTSGNGTTRVGLCQATTRRHKSSFMRRWKARVCRGSRAFRARLPRPAWHCEV